MKISTSFIDLLATNIYAMDMECRRSLQKGHIASERDYVSNLLNFIKYPLGPFSKYRFAHSQTLPNNIEQKYGCDGIIIFKKGDEYKIGVFEAKIIKEDWDSMVRNKNLPRISRFQRQLNNQALLNPQIAVWEMFFNKDDNKKGPGKKEFDSLGSTCVKRDEAIKHSHSKKKQLWKSEDLEKIVLNSFFSNSGNPINIGQIVREMLSCKFGEVIKYTPEGVKLYENNSELKIPLIGYSLDEANSFEIQEFLKETKYFSYTHIDLDKEIDIEKLIGKESSLIGYLIESLPAERKETLSLEALFGAYQTHESAEEIIAGLRASRVFTRTIEPL